MTAQSLWQHSTPIWQSSALIAKRHCHYQVFGICVVLRVSIYRNSFSMLVDEKCRSVRVRSWFREWRSEQSLAISWTQVRLGSFSTTKGTGLSEFIYFVFNREKVLDRSSGLSICTTRGTIGHSSGQSACVANFSSSSLESLQRHRVHSPLKFLGTSSSTLVEFWNTHWTSTNLYPREELVWSNMQRRQHYRMHRNTFGRRWTSQQDNWWRVLSTYVVKDFEIAAGNYRCQISADTAIWPPKSFLVSFFLDLGSVPESRIQSWSVDYTLAIARTLVFNVKKLAQTLLGRVEAWRLDFKIRRFR